MLWALLLASASADVCYRYICAEADMPWKDFVCISYINETFYLKPCDNKFYSYCPQINSPGNSTCQLFNNTSGYQLSWPGESCVTDLNCAHGICQEDMCMGASFNQTCESDEDCNPGLYCGDDDICQFQYQIGESGCSRDYECVNNAGCNLTSTDSGICLPYLSLNTYDAVAPCSNTVNNLCSSGRCASNDTENFYCIYPKSVEMPKICSANSDCQSSVDPILNVTVQSTCSCSYSDTGYAYCGLFPGDEEMQDLRTYLQQWFKYPDINRCNTVRRAAINCIEQYSTPEFYVKYTYYLTQADYYPLLQGNDPCVKKIYTNYYWTLLDQFNEQDDDDSAAYLVMAVVWALM